MGSESERALKCPQQTKVCATRAGGPGAIGDVVAANRELRGDPGDAVAAGWTETAGKRVTRQIVLVPGVGPRSPADGAGVSAADTGWEEEAAATRQIVLVPGVGG